MFSFASFNVRTSLIRAADQCLDYLYSCRSKQMPFSQNCYCSCRLGGLWTKKHRRPITYLTALFHFLDTHPFFCQALGDLKSAVKAGGPWLQRTRAGWDWGWLRKKKGIYIYIYIYIYPFLFISFLEVSQPKSLQSSSGASPCSWWWCLLQGHPCSHPAWIRRFWTGLVHIKYWNPTESLWSSSVFPGRRAAPGPPTSYWW